MKRLKNLALSLVILTGGAYQSIAQTIYVDADALGANDGTSWTNAFLDLQVALDSSTAGDTIWIAEGTYYPSTQVDVNGGGGSDPREVTFLLKDSVSLFGGFDGTESMLSQRDFRAHTTLLSGDIGVKNDSSDNAYHVIYSVELSKATVIDGITISHGHANALGGNNLNFHGGGWLSNSSGSKTSAPVIRNVTFSKNRTAGSGAGMTNWGQNSGTNNPTYLNCIFIDNRSLSGGAAIFNSAYNSGNGDYTATNCLFANNDGSGGNGGALHNDGRQNSQCNPSLINCTFYNNKSNQGAGMYNDANSNGTCTVTVRNCIFWSNPTTSWFNNAGATVNAAYSLINESSNPAGTAAGAGMQYNTDPLFSNTGNNDFTLSANSTAIDSGNSASNTTPHDLAGLARILGTSIDMGCYEYFSCVNTTDSIAPSSCSSFLSPSGKLLTASGLYTDTIPNAAGCDSIITINLTLLDPSTDTINWTDCNQYTSPSGKIFTTSGTYQDTLVGMGASGCDSIITINLTLGHTSFDTTQATVCDSYTSPSGKTFTTSGTYTDTIPNSSNCDSTITINLTVNHPTSATLQDTACFEYTSPSGNSTWNTSGTYQDTIPNAIGCDSALTIELVIVTVDTGVTRDLHSLIADASNINSTFLWLDCDNNFASTSDTMQTFTPSVDGNYAVQVNTDGCLDTSSCYEMTHVGIQDKSAKLSWSAYPNPTSGKVILDFGKRTDNIQLIVRDATGRVVQQLQLDSALKTEIELTGEIGLYFIEVITSDRSGALLRVMKQD